MKFTVERKEEFRKTLEKKEESKMTKISVIKFGKQPTLKEKVRKDLTLVAKNESQEELFLTPNDNFFLVRDGKVVGIVSGEQVMQLVKGFLDRFSA